MNYSVRKWRVDNQLHSSIPRTVWCFAPHIRLWKEHDWISSTMRQMECQRRKIRLCLFEDQRWASNNILTTSSWALTNLNRWSFYCQGAFKTWAANNGDVRSCLLWLHVLSCFCQRQSFTLALSWHDPDITNYPASEAPGEGFRLLQANVQEDRQRQRPREIKVYPDEPLGHGEPFLRSSILKGILEF